MDWTERVNDARHEARIHKQVVALLFTPEGSVVQVPLSDELVRVRPAVAGEILMNEVAHLRAELKSPTASSRSR